MSVVSAIMVPHPPIILPNIGKGEEKRIADIDAAYRQAAKAIVDSKPDTVVLISPHIPSYSDYIPIVPNKSLSGSMIQFGDPQDAFVVNMDQELIDQAVLKLDEKGIRSGTLGGNLLTLDHGTMVPLYYLKDLPEDTKFVLVGVGGLSNLEHAKVGQVLSEAANKLDKKIAIVASGDLSHCQKEDSNYGFKECGPAYDANLMEMAGKGDFVSLITQPEKVADEAMSCGHKSFCTMAGALEGTGFEPHALAHSAEFGVGYGIVHFDHLHPDSSQTSMAKAAEILEERRLERIANEDPYVQLARKTIESLYSHQPVVMEFLPEQMNEPAGVFVSLHKDGNLRGCIGTTAPTTKSITQEIMRNAREAALYDPRFHAVEPWEVDDLEISVDVLKEPEDIESPEQLDVKKYGVIVSDGRRRGLLLPDLEGVDTVEEQIAIARRKAGIDPDDEISLQRFEVVRHV